MKEAYRLRTIIGITLLTFTMHPDAEKYNGWAAMIGIVALVGAYVLTGQIIPGIL